MSQFVNWSSSVVSTNASPARSNKARRSIANKENRSHASPTKSNSRKSVAFTPITESATPLTITVPSTPHKIICDSDIKLQSSPTATSTTTHSPSNHSESINVIVRVRGGPLVDALSDPCISLDTTTSSISVTRATESSARPSHDASLNDNAIKSVKLNFDHIFPANADQSTIFTPVIGLIESALNGYNASVLAYGQTSSGKTYSMVGSLSDEAQFGIIPRSFTHLFQVIQARQCQSVSYAVAVSYMEVYNEKVYDLLGERKCVDIRENDAIGVHIPDLSRPIVESAQSAISIINRANQNRTVAATAHNVVSSRSHAIIEITIERKSNDILTSVVGLTTSRVHLVDLAGSEKYDIKTTVSEMKNINQSLNALSNVIFTLSSHSQSILQAQQQSSTSQSSAPAQPHINYRDSKLTRILRDSLGGSSKTIMIACVSPFPQARSRNAQYS